MTFTRKRVDERVSLVRDISLACCLVVLGVGDSLVAVEVTPVTRRANHGQSA
ncbi:MAG: hypothetical protein KA777_00125 [Rhodoferax sp.]|nr:hypothetical protein [Rhodoferax sp.]MBP7572362.1 hypothetical protein [Rhodoferax sp.]